MREPQVDVWFRNVKLYANECAEVGARKTVWGRYQIKKARMDPIIFSNLKFGVGSGWQTLIIDEREAALYKDGFDRPVAVYPVWNAGWEEFDDLWSLIHNPWGDDLNKCLDVEREVERRPIHKQDHIIVITGLGNMLDPMWKNTLMDLSEIQADNPQVTFFMNQLGSYNGLFGMDFRMGDVDARMVAVHGKITIPSGKEAYVEDLKGFNYWITLLGYTPRQLSVPRNRCMYNIKSAQWAGIYYKRLDKFRTGKRQSIDWRSPDLMVEVMTNNYVLTGRQTVQPGDKIACDECSLWASCKFYRDKAVCAVPGNEMEGVAALFRTRDSDSIIKAMGKLLSVNASRIEVALGDEAKGEGLDPELTKLLNSTMDRAEKLAKLIDPKLTPAGQKLQVNINNNGGHGQVGAGPNVDSRSLSRVLIEQIEATGVPRDQITPEMLSAAAEALAKSDTPIMIEGSVE